MSEALKAYKQEVDSKDLKPDSKETYILHAEHFVRWLRGDFEPGSRL